MDEREAQDFLGLILGAIIFLFYFIMDSKDNKNLKINYDRTRWRTAIAILDDEMSPGTIDRSKDSNGCEDFTKSGYEDSDEDGPRRTHDGQKKQSKDGI